VIEEDDAQSVQSESVQKLQKNVAVYRENLASATQNQLDQLHEMNMSDLESLTIKIKKQMESLERQKDEEPGFGHKTFKTDEQRQHMTQQMKGANPFKSTEVPKEDEVDDLTRHAEPASSLAPNA
jgi:hypothetical protein